MRPLLPIILAALFLYACGGDASEPTLTPTPAATASRTLELTPAPASTPILTPTPPITYIQPLEGSGVLTRQLDRIASNTSGERGLFPLEPVDVNFMTRSELSVFVLDLLEEDREVWS